MDRVLKIPFGGGWLEFATRTGAGSDLTVTDEIVIREIFVENVYQVEAADMADTGAVVDIGGNVGAFSIFAAALGAKAVYAYEPNAESYGVLVENIARNGMAGVIRPLNTGVSDTEKDVEMVGSQGAAFVVGTKPVTDPAMKARLEAMPKEGVHVVSLGSVFAGNGIGTCDILKIDCEGSEYDIIAGAPVDVLAKARYITMEFHSTDVRTFGGMVAKLTQTHNIHIIGRHDMGGQIYARLY
ncbi:MAG: FkbM family methyltransferase [Coriobacteriia bacterium]|nr:FkbM family methyltransferase [Coriobacteriia bacterium]